MTTRKAPTPLRTTPSSAPYEAMAASQQAHIDQLVQQNRTLDHTAKKLREDLAREDARGRDAVQQIQLKWQAERKEWHEGCETLQACHKMAHLRTVVELDKERLAVLQERDVTRRERVAKLQRDYQITMFQVKELELEAKLIDLRDELVVTRLESEEDVQSFFEQHQQALQKLEGQSETLSTELQRRTQDLEEIQAEKEELEAELSKLQEEYETLFATSDSNAAQLERTTLQLDGLRTTNVDLERTNEELKRSNTELKRHLDKWQSLENKGGAEMDTLRKRRIELEVQVKELEGRVDDAVNKEQEQARLAEKYKKKIERYKAVWEEHTQAAEEAVQASEEHQNETEEVKRQLGKALKEVEQLQAELQIERAKDSTQTVVSRTSRKKTTTALEQEDGDDEPGENSDEDITRQATSPHSKNQPKTRPNARPAYRKQPSKSDDEKVEDSDTANKKRRHAARDESDIEEVTKPSKGKGKGRSKAVDEEADVTERTTKRKTKARVASPVEDESDGIEIVEQPHEKEKKGKATESEEISKRRQKRGKQKEEEGDGDIGADATDGKPRGIGRAKKGPAAKRSKPPSQAERKMSKQPDTDDANSEVDEDPVQKKKKRKIAIFGAAQPTSFPWNEFNLGDGGMNIPTELSPVKETEAVPPRSIFGKVGSAFSLGRR